MSLAALTAVLGVFNFGIVVAFLGSIKLRLAERLELDDARMGRLIAVWQATSLVIMLLVGPLLDRFGHRPVLILGFLIVAASILLFAMSRQMSVIFTAAFLLGRKLRQRGRQHAAAGGHRSGQPGRRQQPGQRVLRAGRVRGAVSDRLSV